MSVAGVSIGALEELAEFLAGGPTPDDVLRFRPSAELQSRAEELLEKLKAGCLAADERRELDQFEHAERLIRLTKARIRGSSD